MRIKPVRSHTHTHTHTGLGLFMCFRGTTEIFGLINTIANRYLASSASTLQRKKQILFSGFNI